MATFTELEKKVIRDLLSYGYAFDAGNDGFLAYGMEGKRERGAAASLVKKGVIIVDDNGEDEIVSCGNGYTVDDLVKISGFEW